MRPNYATPEDFAKWRSRAETLDTHSLKWVIADCRHVARNLRGFDPEREGYYEDQAFTYADEAVAYWVRELQFDGPAWLIREHLSGYGAWDRSELCDHQQNLQRLLWVWACDIRESGDDLLYLMR